MPAEKPSALDRSVRALARRDLSTVELDRRLARAGVLEPERVAAIARLTEAGYLDDLRFALGRARVLAERGLGDAAIRHDLVARGVDRSLVQEALGTLEPEGERARRLVRGLGMSARAARLLARKGFASDAIEEARAPSIADTVEHR